MKCASVNLWYMASCGCPQTEVPNGVQGVASSNLAVPTIFKSLTGNGLQVSTDAPFGAAGIRWPDQDVRSCLRFRRLDTHLG